MPAGYSRHADDQQIVYRVQPSDDIGPRFVFALILPVIIFFVALFLWQDFQHTGGLSFQSLCLIPIIVIGLGFAIHYARTAQDHTTLCLSQVGIEYHGLDFGVNTTWENMTAIQEHIPPRILLRQRALTSLGRNWFADAGWYIPLERFGYTRSSLLAADLRRYAPHLFQDSAPSP